MKKITKTISKEYNQEGKLIKHLETIIEEYIEEITIPYIPIKTLPNNPYNPIVVMYGCNPVQYDTITHINQK